MTLRLRHQLLSAPLYASVSWCKCVAHFQSAPEICYATIARPGVKGEMPIQWSSIEQSHHLNSCKSWRSRPVPKTQRLWKNEQNEINTIKNITPKGKTWRHHPGSPGPWSSSSSRMPAPSCLPAAFDKCWHSVTLCRIDTFKWDKGEDGWYWDVMSMGAISAKRN